MPSSLPLLALPPDAPPTQGPLGEQLTQAEMLPIRVHSDEKGRWLVDYGSYAQGYHATRREAIEEAARAAYAERRALTVEYGYASWPSE